MSLRRILYIEDDQDIRVVVTMVRQASGINVEGYSCSQQAIDAAPHASPDLILLDITMPQKDGFQTLAELRKLPGYSSIPAVFLTARIDLTEKSLKPFQPIANRYQSQSSGENIGRRRTRFNRTSWSKRDGR